MDTNSRIVDEPIAANYSPYLLVTQYPDQMGFKLSPSYRFVRITLLTRILPALNIALIVTVLIAFDLNELSTLHIFYLIILSTIPFILLNQSVCIEMQIFPDLIRQRTMNGFGSKSIEHRIEKTDYVEVISTRGRSRVWEFFLKGNRKSTKLFFIPSSSKIWFNLSEQDQSKKNFMELLSIRLKIPVLDTDASNR
jgi:hypothetical protein